MQQAIPNRTVLAAVLHVHVDVRGATHLIGLRRIKFGTPFKCAILFKSHGPPSKEQSKNASSGVRLWRWTCLWVWYIETPTCLLLRWPDVACRIESMMELMGT